jgi:hypothetical protein
MIVGQELSVLMKVTEKPTWKQEIGPFWLREAPEVERQVLLRVPAVIAEIVAVAARKHDSR